jgi:hypothetical protein
MPITIIDQETFDNYTYTKNAIIGWDSSAHIPVFIPDHAQRVIVLRGIYGLSPDPEVDPDTPVRGQVLGYAQDNWAGQSVDGAAYAYIHSTPATGGYIGSETISVFHRQDPKVYGAGVALIIYGVDRTKIEDPINETPKASGSSGTSGGISVVSTNPQHSLLTVVAVKGNQTITPDANQQILVNMKNIDNTITMMVTHSWGSKTKAASFTWGLSASWAIAGIVIETPSGGNQIAVIG